jgi:hypothetical protein
MHPTNSWYSLCCDSAGLCRAVICCACCALAYRQAMPPWPSLMRCVMLCCAGYADLQFPTQAISDVLCCAVLCCGFQTGYADLQFPTQASNNPITEVWVYDPAALKDRRYTATGVRSRIARLYHSAVLLTSEGDGLITGCSNCRSTITPLLFSLTLMQ